MAKKVVELSTKRKVELRELSIDDMDYCSDLTIVKLDKDGEVEHIANMSKARTAWLRRGIKGGDFKAFKLDAAGLVVDNVLKQLSEVEKNELMNEIQDYQKMGEETPSS